jgi:hypothetical protein
MKFREDSTKGEMMDEQKIRAEAWQEGRTAGYRQHVLGDLANRPVNPYAPVVKYTPTNQEITKAVLKTFTEDEMLRYFHQRERDIAEYERGMVVEELQQLRSVDVEPLVVQTINHCVGMIKRMKG